MRKNELFHTRDLGLNAKEMEEKKNDLIAQAEKLVADAKAEERSLTEEEIEQLKKLQSEAKSLKDAIELDEQFRALEPKEDETDDEETKEVEEQEERAFDAYLRNELEERATNLTKTNNGAVVPTSIAKKIISKVYEICPILDKSTHYNVKGTLEIPYYDEETSAITVAYQDEFSAMSSNVGSFKNIQLSGFLAGALSLVSLSLINNSDFDLVGFVTDKMAEAIKRFIEKELLVGTDGKVEGLSKLKNKVTAAAKTAISADDLIDTQDAVLDTYQNNCIWIMNKKTRSAIRHLKDGNGRFLLQDDVTSPFGKTLLGKPVYTTDAMDGIEAGKTAIYYGDMSGLATKWVEEINIKVLREKYIDQHAVGVIGWLEFDAKVENEQKISSLVMPE